MNSEGPHIHLIGICGTAMGAVAAMLQAEGWKVSGSDEKAYPPMSDFLKQKGILVREGFSADNLVPPPDLVLVGNAISRGNPELEAALDARLPYISLPEAMRRFFLQKSHNLVVTGTHGKTTTSALLAWLLEAGAKHPGFLIGGIPLNFGQGCRRGGGAYWVLEGDEYDTAFFDKRSKFLHYQPELVIINNVEFDHADIFPDFEAVKRTFRHLMAIVPSNGMVLVNADDPAAVEVSQDARAQIVEIGLSPNAGLRIDILESTPQGSTFRLLDQSFFIPMAGTHNIRNAAMAAAAAHFYQVPHDTIRTAMASFLGVKRRQEIISTQGGITLIDDFGHHPTAIRETIAALRQSFPGRRIHALFEPRSNTSRRNTFQNLFPQALAGADTVWIGPVDRATTLTDALRLNPQKLAADLTQLGTTAHACPDAASLVRDLSPQVQPGDVIVVFSNGAFDGIFQRLKQALNLTP